jgi:GntR family transcriptional regulator
VIVGLRWAPGQWRGEEIRREHLERGEQVLVTFRPGDTLASRAPNHYEARRLRTNASEAVVEIGRADMTREVYRSSLVALQPEDGELLVLEPDGQGDPVYVDAAGIVVRAKVDGPDLTKPQWRQVYEDIRADIEAGRLKPGDRIPTLDYLVKMYGFSSTSILKALQILQAERRIEGRSRIGRFVSCRS